ASNYTLAGETLKGDISKRVVTVSGITASGKTYDGNTDATISKAGVLSNLVGAETLVVSTTGSFTNQNAGDRTVNTSTGIADGANG
ncbi:YDG domain-containing protein, partial [Acinetobacter baumannii]